MKATIRTKLVAAFLAILLVGTIASVGALTLVSRSIGQLQLVLDRDDVIARRRRITCERTRGREDERTRGREDERTRGREDNTVRLALVR